MHNRTFWVDQVEDQDGQVIQQGTLIDQAHLNNITDQKDEGRGCSFKDITAGSAVGDAAKLVLMALALMPDAALTGTGIDTTYGGDYFWFNNGAEERLPLRGGNWGNGAYAGLFSLYLDSPRGDSYWGIGGRSAFVELPAAD